MLASGSPRRRQILGLLGLDFEVRIPPLKETVREGEPPAEAAKRLAEEKLSSVSLAPGELVVAADTVVAVGDQILGKPADTDAAVEMLLRLGGREHAVYTGLALALDDRTESGVAGTSVWFRSLARPECEEYVGTGEPLDKAGAYGIQGLGAALVERIEGEYFNVMGLPVQLLLTLLSRLGIRYAYGCLVAV